jgi:hypothetical protein
MQHGARKQETVPHYHVVKVRSRDSLALERTFSRKSIDFGVGRSAAARSKRHEKKGACERMTYRTMEA